MGAASAEGVRKWLTCSKVRIPYVGSVSVSEIFGHSAFLLAGTAFLDPDILNLRILSVGSGCATLVFTYFHPVGKPLWLPFIWNVFFIGINTTYIYRILSEQRSAERLPPVALDVWRSVFSPNGMSAVDFAKLLGAGTWTTLRTGATLQQEGEASASVFLVVGGGVDVRVGGRRTTRLGSGNFFGDTGSHVTARTRGHRMLAVTEPLVPHARHCTGLANGIFIGSPMKGVATVTTNAQTTCLVWPRQQLADLLERHPTLAAAFQSSLAADVMRKLRTQDLEARHPRLTHCRWAQSTTALAAHCPATTLAHLYLRVCAPTGEPRGRGEP